MYNARKDPAVYPLHLEHLLNSKYQTSPILFPNYVCISYLTIIGSDCKNPLHLDVVDRYLRRMGDKTIPDEAPPSLESFFPHESQVSIYRSQGVVDSLSRSPINTNKGVF